MLALFVPKRAFGAFGLILSVAARPRGKAAQSFLFPALGFFSLGASVAILAACAAPSVFYAQFAFAGVCVAGCVEFASFSCP